MDDLISREAAIDAINGLPKWIDTENGVCLDYADVIAVLSEHLPSAQPEIIRCKDCKHWTQSTGKMTGYGLGRCDFHDADLVACNGFCYWAEPYKEDRDR